MRTRLERLLEIRRREVESARLAMARAFLAESRARSDAEKSLTLLTDLSAGMLSRLQGMGFSRSTLGELGMSAARLERIRTGTVDTLVHYAGARNGSDSARRECLGFERRTKTLERLCEKRAYERIRDAERREEVEADDVQCRDGRL